MASAQLDQSADELAERLVARLALPVEPGNLVVLAVAVVVPALGSPDLVAPAQHRHALREEERGQEAPLLPITQRQDRQVLGRPLDAAVPAGVVVRAVAV